MAAPSAARERGSSPAALPWLLRAAFPVALFGAALAAFWPCVNQGFVALDDDANFELNFLFRGLGAEQLRWMRSGYHYGHWHPLTWLTFGIDYTLWGLDGAAFHRTNLVVHACAVVAFYLCAVELLRWIARWVSVSARATALDRSQAVALRAAAALAAVTWGLHPLRAESVAWATERRDLLSALFLALTLWAYLRRCRYGAARWPWLALALSFYALSLLSKAWGMTLPVVLLALDVFPLRRATSANEEGRHSIGRLAAEKLWFVPFALFTALQAKWAQEAIGAAVSLQEHTPFMRVAQAAYGLCFYLLKTLWPTNLSCHYLLEIDFDPTRPVYLAAIAAVALVTIALVAAARRFPAGITTWFCYGVLVSPVLGLFQSGTQKVADRYAHLCSMPLSMLAAGATLVWIAGRAGAPARSRAASLAVVVTAVLAALFGSASNLQTRTWKDSESLFRRGVEVEPDNYFMLHNLAVTLYRRGAYDEALELDKRSVAAHPRKGNEEARHTLGLLYSMRGEREQAEREWRDALAVAPDHERSLQSLSGPLLARGEVDEVIELYRAALRANPRYLAGYTRLDGLYRQRARPADALAMWEGALGVAGIPRGLAEGGAARALIALGRIPEAEKRAIRAVIADKSQQEVLEQLAQRAAQQGVAAALEFWERARREYVPASVVENGLGKVLMSAARYAEAEPHLFTAQSLDNTNKDYVVDVCELFLRTGRLGDAEKNLRLVLDADPGHARAQELMRRIQAAKAGR